MYARIQTWFACNVQIGQNGREWLARQMTREGLCYHQQGNCLVGIDVIHEHKHCWTSS